MPFLHSGCILFYSQMLSTLEILYCCDLQKKSIFSTCDVALFQFLFLFSSQIFVPFLFASFATKGTLCVISKKDLPREQFN